MPPAATKQSILKQQLLEIEEQSKYGGELDQVMLESLLPCIVWLNTAVINTSSSLNPDNRKLRTDLCPQQHLMNSH